LDKYVMNKISSMVFRDKKWALQWTAGPLCRILKCVS